ncbi:hypothetical protein OMAG_002516 [Candidatus Omnitrophus magneticus]|uniref:Uncharacterized protein n=1 Tax=Candidatus Omnitrophus magneticus TaxID=1609969 RepID=A0A0F0CK45_9BACT|nr:hypothetical protein OMAG_002516 [Candidatus Omnitrophus magneticus]
METVYNCVTVIQVMDDKLWVTALGLSTILSPERQYPHVLG